MSAPDISPQVTEWARLAGYALTPEDETGAALFWSDPGGAIRYYIRTATGGGYTLTSSERTLPEQFELSARSMTAIERHLIGVFGSDYRSKNRLPVLATPSTEDDMADGYRIRPTDTAGFWALLDNSGELIAVAEGKINSLLTLCTLSHLMVAALSDITASYRSADGSPLFHTR